jgi:hypothetical protein
MGSALRDVYKLVNLDWFEFGFIKPINTGEFNDNVLIIVLFS